MIFLAEVPGQPSKYRCTACCRTISCGHMGKADIVRHQKSDGHGEAVRMLKNQHQMTQYDGEVCLSEICLIVLYHNTCSSSVVVTAHLLYLFWCISLL